MSWRGLHKDVRKSLEDYSSTLDTIDQVRQRKWRSLDRYSSRRNEILSVLSSKMRSHDDHSEAVLTELLFPKKLKKSSISEVYKFTVPDVLSPRMQQLLRTNRRPFGGEFRSLVKEKNKEKKPEIHVPETLAMFIQEEIGKYQMKRMDRLLLRIPEKTRVVAQTDTPNEMMGSGPGRRKLSFLLLKSKLPAMPFRRKQQSETPEVENAILMDAKRATKDMKVNLRTERLLAGSQAVNLSAVKTFKANLKDLMPSV